MIGRGGRFPASAFQPRFCNAEELPDYSPEPRCVRQRKPVQLFFQVVIRERRPCRGEKPLHSRRRCSIGARLSSSFGFRHFVLDMRRTAPTRGAWHPAMIRRSAFFSRAIALACSLDHGAHGLKCMQIGKNMNKSIVLRYNSEKLEFPVARAAVGAVCELKTRIKSIFYT